MPDGPVIDTNLGPAPAAPANPVSTLGGLVGIGETMQRIQQTQLQNTMALKTIQARHQMGDDLAVLSAKGMSPEDQMSYISHQDYAPWIANDISTFRGAQLGALQAQEVQQRMRSAGLGPLTEALAATNGDLTKFPAAFDIATRGLPAEIQAQLRPAYDAIKTSVTANGASHEQIQTNLRNLGVVFGLPLATAYAIGGGIAPTVTEVPSPSGAMTKEIVSGGPQGGAVQPLGTGPSTAQQEQMKIQGQQAGGIAPSFETITGPQGQPIPAIISGGGGGAPPKVSPLLMGPLGATTSKPPEETPAPPESALSHVMMGPGLAAAEFLKGTGQLGKDIQEEVNSNAHSLPTMAKRVDLMSQALQQFQTGGFADTREGLAKMAQGLRNAGLDISDDTIQKISNGSLPAQQVFQSLVSRAGVQALKQDAQGTGRVMRSEVDRYLEMMGDTNDPRALTTLVNNLRYTLLVGYDQGQKFTQFKQALAKEDPSVKGLDISDFPSVYNRDFDENSLMTPKGISLAPVAAGAFKGSGGEATGGSKRPPIESFFK